jgi:hypothetical protein
MIRKPAALKSGEAQGNVLKVFRQQAYHSRLILNELSNQVSAAYDLGLFKPPGSCCKFLIGLFD